MEQEDEKIRIEKEEEETGPYIITKKRRSLTNETKLEIVHLAQNSSIRNAARQTGLDLQVVSKWCQTEAALQNTGLKRHLLVGADRKPLSEQLNDQVYEWLKQKRGLKLAVSYKCIKARAIFLSGELELYNFSGSKGWLERFMARKGNNSLPKAASRTGPADHRFSCLHATSTHSRELSAEPHLRR